MERTHQRELKDALERLYKQYTRPEYVHPDPLELVYRYSEQVDREIAGLVAATLAYGRVSQILKSAEWVLERLGRSPSETLAELGADRLGPMFAGFRHRWTTGEEMAALLAGMGMVVREHGSLRRCFVCGYAREEETVLPALASFVECLGMGHAVRNSLLPDPRRGSACKRLHMYLRWMVRSDEVDPGGWDEVSPAKLVVPVDVHMHRVGRAMGLTRRKQADGRTALEMTAAFREFSPGDPVRYDFALTRLGIRDDTDPEDVLRLCRESVPLEEGS